MSTDHEAGSWGKRCRGTISHLIGRGAGQTARPTAPTPRPCCPRARLPTRSMPAYRQRGPLARALPIITVRPHSAGCRGAEFSLPVTLHPRPMINTSNTAGGIAITCIIVVVPPAGGPYENTKVQTAHHITVKYAQIRNLFFRTRRSAINLAEGFDLGARCSVPGSLLEPKPRFGGHAAAAADPTTVATIRITPTSHSTAITETS
jgi:hypothetical protein